MRLPVPAACVSGSTCRSCKSWALILRLATSTDPAWSYCGMHEHGQILCMSALSILIVLSLTHTCLSVTPDLSFLFSSLYVFKVFISILQNITGYCICFKKNKKNCAVFLRSTLGKRDFPAGFDNILLFQFFL